MNITALILVILFALLSLVQSVTASGIYFAIGGGVGGGVLLLIVIALIVLVVARRH
jgi:uncharacterized membrane protein